MLRYLNVKLLPKLTSKMYFVIDFSIEGWFSILVCPLIFWKKEKKLRVVQHNCVKVFKFKPLNCFSRKIVEAITLYYWFKSLRTKSESLKIDLTLNHSKTHWKANKITEESWLLVKPHHRSINPAILDWFHQVDLFR